ncbi:MAG: glycosyltransferase family 32 protein [Myxococcota bacterium]
MTAPEIVARRGARFLPIPRVLHQTWKDADLPERFQAYHATWRRQHPGWRFVLWTDADNRRLVASRHAGLLSLYDALPRDIQRVDLAKYLILASHGGVYADLDSECLRPVDALLAGGGAVVSRTPDGVIDGAFLASPPGHAFWEHVLREVQAPPLLARALRGVPGLDASHVLFSTGPHMLRRAVRRYDPGAPAHRGDGLRVLASRHVSSRSWLARREPFREVGASVRHHHADSWLLPLERAVVRFCTARHLAGAALALVAAALLAAATA